ncbi:putative signal transducing protein [Arsenicibacter rosenii]|uniref:DUF2007 domain-containing protein n=1 Tax=Arsenicibacter rosenii TaxID=1750698 RepID=A0A1S2VBC2_9BACT|nr:DUF2007 domain-containing protein [Arsenicibacter rosenii]OIN56003.1 hypothetical protein BLX24_27020 [Arsenicibacter rosenii]
METPNNIEFVQVYAGSIMQAEVVKSLLENEEINAFLKDGFLGTLAPWWASPGGMGAVKVIVSKTDVDKAKAIIEAYQQNEPEDTES